MIDRARSMWCEYGHGLCPATTESQIGRPPKDVVADCAIALARLGRLTSEEQNFVTLKACCPRRILSR